MAVRVASRGARRRGARAALAALVPALGVALAAAPVPASAQPADAPGADRPRAAILFLPAPARASERLLDELADRRLATGLTSPTVGGYSPEQVLLDISQGARLSGAAYAGLLAGLDLRVRNGSGRIEGWGAARRRAEQAAGTVQPGLLASTVAQAGGSVAYAGVSEPRDPGVKEFELGAAVRRPVAPPEPEEEAVVAADRAGRVERVSLGSARTLADRAVALWRGSELLVARLPPGDAGLRALDRILVSGGGGDLVYVLRSPPADMELLPTGVRSSGLAGLLTSDTTRQAGLVAAPDATATVLGHLEIEVPSAMQGQEVESEPGSVEELAALSDRLSVVAPRREPALLWVLGGWLALLAALALARRGAGVRAGLRLGLLTALWLPALALLAAALRPSEAAEVAILVVGGLGLAAATDRLVPWPAGPAVPAAVTLASHAIDIVAGSPLVATSLVGPNPIGGARFFGVGNELEVILSLTVLFGVAGALALRREERSGAAPWAFALACGVAAVILGAGQLGAAVGAVITLAAGGATAVLASLAARPGRRAVALAIAAPVVGLACLAAIDVATAGGAHFTREVLQGDDPGELLDTIERRLDLSASGLERGGKAVAVGVATLLLVVGVVKRRALLAPLDGAPRVAARAFQAGLVGALVATVVGALANDSGPTMLLIGTVILALAVGYVQGRPRQAPSGVI